MSIRPLGDRVVVEKITKEVTETGIILPDTAQGKSQTAIVYAVGPGTRLEDGSYSEMTVKIGDNVLVSKYAGTEIEMEGKDYTVLRIDDILAIIDR